MTDPKETSLKRRKVLKGAAVAAGAACAAGMAPKKKRKRRKDDDDDRRRGRGRGRGRGRDRDDDRDEDEFDPGDVGEGTPFNFEPFTVEMPIPVVKQPLSVGAAPFTPGDVFHGIAPEFFDRTLAENPSLNYYEAFPTKWYEMRIQFGVHEIIPGVQTPIMGYDGIFPGPTFKARIGQPVVVRTWNDLNVEQSVHLHGGHNPAHSDGYPNFYVLPGRARDYYWTNTVPTLNGQPDFTEAPSTMWYHDHAMDLTAHHVWEGLAGFFITTDQIEQDLIDSNVLPGDPYDIPIVLQDRRFNADGTLFFDPLDHNGTLGDVWVTNGKAQPFMRVQRRKYRFRLLNGCNARFLEMRLNNGQPFISIGKDSWLFPQAIEQNTLMLSMAQRADVVIDFTDAPNEVILENILSQDDGRGPRGDLEEPERQIPGAAFLKFIVEDGPVNNNSTVEVGTPLRPHIPLREEEAVITREFEFHRRRGAWQINDRFFDPDLANATPTLGTVEKWILRNGGGGWWHPIHIHLESHQIISINGLPPEESRAYKNDTVILDGGGEAEILMNFRTFRGPFVFHCHNLEHEDMRMMFTFDPRVDPTPSPQPIQQSFP